MRLLLYFISIIVVSCTSPVVFDDAYPTKTQLLKDIPDDYQGAFMCESNSTVITINDKQILALEYVFFQENIEKLEERTACTLIDDEIYLDEIEDCIPIEYVGEDSIKGEYVRIDTLFDIFKGHIVKPLKGNLILSQKMETKEYILSVLSRDEYGNVMYRAINENSDLDQLADITNMKQISVDRNNEPIFKVKPTQKEFEEILAHPEIFIVCEYLIRINLEEYDHYLF